MYCRLNDRYFCGIVTIKSKHANFITSVLSFRIKTRPGQQSDSAGKGAYEQVERPELDSQNPHGAGRGQNWLLQVVLWPLYTHHGRCEPAQTHKHRETHTQSEILLSVIREKVSQPQFLSVLRKGRHGCQWPITYTRFYLHILFRKGVSKFS